MKNLVETSSECSKSVVYQLGDQRNMQMYEVDSAFRVVRTFTQKLSL